MKRIKIMLTMLFTAALSQYIAAQENKTQVMDDLLLGIKNDSANVEFKNKMANYEYLHSQERIDDIWKHRGTYLNISWVTQEFAPTSFILLPDGTNIGNPLWKSIWGVGFSWGRQMYFCQTRPIANILEFAIDYSWMDLNAAQYDVPTGVNSCGISSVPKWAPYNVNGKLDPNKLKMYQFDFGMSIGPSITVNPISELKVSAYYHVTPTWSCTLLDKNFHGNYATFMSIGAAVSFNVISLGWETRWGKGKYNSFFNSTDYFGWDSYKEEDLGMSKTNLDALGVVLSSKEEIEYKTSSTRFYISFRF